MSTNEAKPVVAAQAVQQAAERPVVRDRFDAIIASVAARKEAERKQSPRERESANFGGMQLKLAVKWNTPGYTPYWANDVDGAIETLLYEGFEFATPEEARMQSAIVADGDVGHRVSRYVGRQEDGSPMRAYLMKCPDDIWKEREAARYRQADAWDSAIKAGKIQHGDGRYKPKGTDIDLNTHFSKEY